MIKKTARSLQRNGRGSRGKIGRQLRVGGSWRGPGPLTLEGHRRQPHVRRYPPKARPSVLPGICRDSKSCCPVWDRRTCVRRRLHTRTRTRTPVYGAGISPVQPPGRRGDPAAHPARRGPQLPASRPALAGSCGCGSYRAWSACTLDLRPLLRFLSDFILRLRRLPDPHVDGMFSVPASGGLVRLVCVQEAQTRSDVSLSNKIKPVTTA